VTAPPSRAQPADLDLVIQGASVLDGSGATPFTADVGISGGRIAAIGDIAGAGPSCDTVNADGLTLTPGFIDIHSHADISLLADPTHAVKALQGVTTEVFSNCGIGFAPVDDAAMAAMRGAFGGLFSRDHGVAWDWRSTSEYLDRLRTRDLGANVAYLVPHGAIRATVMGMAGRPAEADEIERMRRILGGALEAGARGLSTGPGYAPMSHARPDEIVALARDAGFCAIHQRDYRSGLIQCTRETVSMARASRARFQLSHLQTSGPSAAGKAAEAVGVLADARRDGVDIACDMYPYTAGSTVLPAILPDWLTEGGPDATLARLADAPLNDRIETDLHALDRYWPSMVLLSVGSSANERYVGMTFPEIAEARNETMGLLVCRLLVEEHLQVCYLVHHMQADDLDTILAWEHTSIGSDGLHLNGPAHPRVAGTFVRWLGHFVRDRRLVDLPEAVRKATSAPAERLGLSDRGRIAVGMAADLVLFDPASVGDRATYDDPALPPTGIVGVWVNGVRTVRDGKTTGAGAGKVLTS